MNKEDLVARLAERMDSTKAQAAEIVTALFAPDGLIADELAAGGDVALMGFGVFEARPVAARQHRNPKTGEPVTVPAHRRPAFRAGSGLKARVAV